MEKRKSMYTRDYKKLGFIVSGGGGQSRHQLCWRTRHVQVSPASRSLPQNHVNPAVDFTQIPPGMLALDNMLYFARHHQDAYIRVSLRLPSRGCFLPPPEP